MRKRMFSTLVLLAVMLIAGNLIAGVPAQINYQGFLTDDGEPFTGDKPMVFRLYDAENMGTMIWESGSATVPVNNGLYTYKLGTSDGVGVFAEIDWAQYNEIWLSVEVDGAELPNKTKIVSVPYALCAKDVDPDSDITVNNLTVAQDLNSGNLDCNNIDCFKLEIDMDGNIILDEDGSIILTGGSWLELNSGTELQLKGNSKISITENARLEVTGNGGISTPVINSAKYTQNGFAGGIAPVGSVMMFANVMDESSGWLKCDGRTIGLVGSGAGAPNESDDYASLITFLRTGDPDAYINDASGDLLPNAQQVRLPDLRGVFVRGIDDRVYVDEAAAETNSTAGKDPDGERAPGSFQNDAFETHKHNMNGSGFGASLPYANSEADNFRIGWTTAGGYAGWEDGGMENRSKNVAMYYYIKFK